MTSFFIIPYEPTEWKTAKSDLKIDPEWYQQRLMERWPNIEFITPITNAYILEWSIPVTAAGARINGGLQKDFQIVSMDTPFEQFILWHRNIIPSHFRLYLLSDSSWSRLELTKDTTFEDIDKFMKSL